MVALALLVGLSACTKDPVLAPPLLDIVQDGSVQAVVDADAAVPGAFVGVMFVNHVDQEYWFNPCERFVERYEAGGWRRFQEMRLCNSMAYILRPNASREESVDVPSDLAVGTYRFVFPMRPPATGEVSLYLASTTFEVRAGGR
jgi:hypothetical protein